MIRLMQRAAGQAHKEILDGFELVIDCFQGGRNYLAAATNGVHEKFNQETEERIKAALKKIEGGLDWLTDMAEKV